ncbi:hypothetical protein BLS_007650 [Venturia inaequalis]|uniref:cutinase n=1 Tax=Venturia inaequalis TaxID=5025 RepID=A0A8H3Z2Y7_VENIN|nr:hypothetical protein BLS_007650 [Venturia inaequalis]RDI77768.1 hypothetical protein Vi05172_g12243 [Venturia inaequalis]
MLSKTFFLGLSLLSGLVSAEGLVAGEGCRDQSCWIASLSGSTNDPYTLHNGKRPSGGSVAGDKCVAEQLKKLGQPMPPGLRGVHRRHVGDAIDSDVMEAGEIEKRQGSCKAYSMIWGRGTTELGTMGSTVGPMLSTALGREWYVEGVSYTADLAGINCVGLPGGINCIKQIDALSAKCPSTKIVLAGYSQGAMVARICAAFAGEAAKKQTYALALFGDPFNGASVKGIPQEKIKSWCEAKDGVCGGGLNIGMAHLAYTSNGSVKEAAKWMNEMVKQA